MDLYEKYEVTVSIGLNEQLVQKEFDDGVLPQVRTKEVQTYGYVYAELAGEGFDIVQAPLEAVQQVNNPVQAANWTWTVSPQEPGEHRILKLRFCSQKTTARDGGNCGRAVKSEEILVRVTSRWKWIKYYTYKVAPWLKTMPDWVSRTVWPALGGMLLLWFRGVRFRLHGLADRVSALFRRHAPAPQPGPVPGPDRLPSDNGTGSD